MEKESIIKVPGAQWKHNLLYRLAISKEFPCRLRIQNIIRKFWNLDLLKYTTPSGLKLVLDVTDWVQHQIYLHGNYEIKSVELFKRLSKNSSVVFDIGAHIGQYALECSKDDNSLEKKIFAIEVNPKTFTYLLNNIQVNNFKNVKPILGAVGSSKNVVNINIPAYWNMGNTMINHELENVGLDNYLAATLSLPDILKTNGIFNIDLIKIDVEGHEIHVFKELFGQNIYPKDIIFEYIPKAFKGADDLIMLFRDNGYHIKDINNIDFIGQDNILEQNLWATKV
ncbi:FkbM family methyltransferase [Pedobacter boryungensis]|uniref:FkbM family methyltransferase n=1 Tax=Pedobacter boryungensis TaxID=869962 RepID=A0ABX2DAY5_9SPHI|nr:FkbM family methyltransferase [Pedobacter boryungensis]NQX30176.1 FkbM family methyltransferase [Pedobacter boryungensis]